MKKMNKKLITLMLAGTLCAATAGALIAGAPMNAAADEPTYKTYELSKIFSASDTDILGAKKRVESDAEETTTFTLSNGETVEYRNDLALKWYEAANSAKYLTVTFAFEEVNFTAMSFVFENTPAQATKDDKSINTVKFTKTDTGFSVGVLHGEEETAATTTDLAYTAKDLITLSLGAGEKHGEFDAKVNDTSVGTMTNVGANYADSSDVDTLVIKAESAAEVSSVVYFDSLNGQTFANVKTENEKKVVTDKALPVLVVNEEVSGFLLGTAFSLDYTAVDVLDDDPTDLTKYYQYNPADEKPTYDTLKTTTYFMETTYYKDGDGKAYAETAEGRAKTSVYREYGAEYVSVQITLGDDTYNSEDYYKTYNLDWYVEDADALPLPTFTQGAGTENEVTTTFLVVDRNTTGATYNYIVAGSETEKANLYRLPGAVVDTDGNGEESEAEKEAATQAAKAALEAEIAEYQVLLEEAAKSKYAGSNEDLEIPSLAWLIDDNNGYQALEFTISYKTPSSTSAQSSSGKNFNELEISATEEGLYEFKVFATDAAGNTMKYWYKEELVSVSTSNVWEIEEIPAFTYEIKNQGIKIEEKSDKLDSEVLDETYSFTDATVTGASNEQSAYALYFVDVEKYNNSLTGNEKRLVVDTHLAGIDYSEIQEEVGNEILAEKRDSYFEVYLDAYATLVANKVNSTADRIKACFTVIDAYDARITEANESAWEASDNKYNWQPSAKSFKAVEEGLYMILADYWDGDMAYVDRAAAYMLIEVDAEADVIKGETEWLKNNMISVILFSIAAVMLILIIILLLVKPSDETLEDVDAKAAAKKTAEKQSKKK